MTYGYDRAQLAALARGENPDAPRDEREDALAELRAEVTALKHKLRCAEYERDAARSDKELAVSRLYAQIAPADALAKRLWGLYDRKRKTLPMQSLKDALAPPAGGGQ